MRLRPLRPPRLPQPPQASFPLNRLPSLLPAAAVRNEPLQLVPRRLPGLAYRTIAEGPRESNRARRRQPGQSDQIGPNPTKTELLKATNSLRQRPGNNSGLGTRTPKRVSLPPRQHQASSIQHPVSINPSMIPQE